MSPVEQLDPHIPLKAMIEEAKASKLTRIVFMAFAMTAISALIGGSSRVIVLQTLVWLLLILADQQLRARHFKKQVEALEDKGYTIHVGVGFGREQAAEEPTNPANP